jgi:hypothetical protein
MTKPARCFHVECDQDAVTKRAFRYEDGNSIGVIAIFLCTKHSKKVDDEMMGLV